MIAKFHALEPQLWQDIKEIVVADIGLKSSELSKSRL